MTCFPRFVAAAASALLLISVSPRAAQAPQPADSRAQTPAVQRSNSYALTLLRGFAEYSPEAASRFGLTGFDDKVIDLRAGFVERLRADMVKRGTTVKADLALEKDPFVRQDLQILVDANERAIRRMDLEQKYLIPYIELPQVIFQGIRSLLDDQTAPERRGAALVRLRRYAGMEPGSQPVVELAEAYTRERIKQPGLVGPYKGEIEKNLAQTQYFVAGVQKLFAKYNVPGYEPVFARLKEQVTSYDAFLRSELLPRARGDFRLPPDVYGTRLEDFGITASPDELSAMGHKAFDETQKEMQALAESVAAAKGINATDYRDVILALKKTQVEGDAIMELYKKRIGEIEQIIREHHLVSLPVRPMIFRFATEAESAAVPAPHMDIPQLVNNTGQKGAFVLPLKIPAAAGQQGEQTFDDFNFDAASWTLTAHEGRPGHELQFDTIVERGVSLARAVFAMNSVNAEGWGLYSEGMLYPYMPDDGRLISLQHRLLRAARAFLDPELQMGKVTPEQARTILTHDVVLSTPMANQEVERYMFWAPGQAPSYYFGFSNLLSIRHDVEKALGPKFDQQKFHDFILEQGLLPPALLRQAVTERFVPQARTVR